MGIVNTFNRISLEREVAHREVECTYSIINSSSGEKILQIDTYGSADRQFPGKKSQSIRFTSKAIRQLREIISKEL